MEEEVLQSGSNRQKAQQMLILGVGLLVVVVLSSFFLLSKKTGAEPKDIGKQTARDSSINESSEVLGFTSASDRSLWQEYTNEKFKYSFNYPPEFKIESRGKIAAIEDLLALTFDNNSKSITIVKIQITNEIPESLVMVQESGKDVDGNEVLTYKFPYGAKKTLTIIGTAFSTVDKSMNFKEVISAVASSLKISL